MIVEDATQDADATVMGTIVNANFWDLEKCCICITVLYCIVLNCTAARSEHATKKFFSLRIDSDVEGSRGENQRCNLHVVCLFVPHPIFGAVSGDCCVSWVFGMRRQQVS